MDSRASRHIVGDESLLQDTVVCDDQDGLTPPNDETAKATLFGKVTFETLVDDEAHDVNISDVYYAPSLSKNLHLISYGRLNYFFANVLTVLLSAVESRRTFKLCLKFG